MESTPTNGVVRRSLFMLAAMSTLLLIGQPPALFAQSPEPPQPTSQPSEATDTSAAQLTTETIQARISQIKSATDLPENVKLEAAGFYGQSLEQITLANSFSAKIAEHQKGIEETPALLEEAKGKLAQAASEPTTQAFIEVSPEATLDQLRQQLDEAKSGRDGLKQRQETAKKLEDEAKYRSERRIAVPGLIQEANKRLEQVAKDLGAPATAATAPQVSLAQRTLLQARKLALELEVKQFDNELRFFDARSDLLTSRRELAKLAVVEAQAKVTHLETAIGERREAEIERQKREAEEALKRAPLPIRDLPAANTRLAERRDRVDQRIKEVEARLPTVDRLIVQLDKDFQSAQLNVRNLASTDVVGPLLRKKKSELAQLREYEHEREALPREIAQCQLDISEADDAGLKLSDIDAEVAEVLASIQEADPETDAAKYEKKVRNYLTTKRESLGSLKADLAALTEKLNDLSGKEATLVAKLEQFRNFIDRHVLWSSSTTPLYDVELPDDGLKLARKWVALAIVIWNDIRHFFFPYLIIVVIVAVLLAYQPRLLRAMLEISKRTSRVKTDSFSLTLGTLAYTLLIPLPWTIVLWFIGWRATSIVGIDEVKTREFALAVGGGFRVAAAFLFTSGFIWQMCRTTGLAVSHFRWDAKSVRLVRRPLTWLIAIGLPATFLIGATELYVDSRWSSSFGRLAFLVAMIAAAIFIHQVLRPSHGILADRFRKSKTGWLYHLRYLWFSAAIAIPAGLFLASFSGYHYTAIEFAKRLTQTLWFVLGLMLIQALLARWMFILRRKLALDQAAAKKQELADAARSAGKTPSSEMVTIDEAKLSLVDIGEQTKRLLRTFTAFTLLIGVWFVWSDMMPALSFMEDVRLSSYTVDVAAPSGEAGAATTTMTEVRYITLANVAVAMIVVVATFILARNIPGLLEITILNKLPLDTGGRFALTAVVRYLIVVVGIVIAFGAVGIGWTNVQWLVAAISVGLGFGLQEIFANFVSGLMLLFERPIRIGDTVTVGQISGTVTQIRIRATTITDWDRKELVIPNKEFITGQVINWTLSDSILRVNVPVGIAYGSDTDLAEEILLRIGKNTEHVMDNPEVYVLFKNFGASSLDYELRVFVPGVEYLLPVRHALNKAIDREFRRAGIEIAFPQQDVHIRSIHDALPIAEKHREQKDHE